MTKVTYEDRQILRSTLLELLKEQIELVENTDLSPDTVEANYIDQHLLNAVEELGSVEEIIYGMEGNMKSKIEKEQEIEDTILKVREYMNSKGYAKATIDNVVTSLRRILREELTDDDIKQMWSKYTRRTLRYAKRKLQESEQHE